MVTHVLNDPYTIPLTIAHTDNPIDTGADTRTRRRRRKRKRRSKKSEKYWGQRQNGWAGAVIVGWGW